ncbi:WD40/YVTN/BNR-like repeat-containing protein [Desulforhopalus singaporensis]|uniref:Photosynthesis system II assembly factor Ycf48/Hcf136-like domain-containing protein n=1 Tax=Desulforhopalus singaporensis TaxID=91360 RepID=A0A1H0SCU5_9BACT|nr:YCF48-related protein [Desulforhopalus singaporensis]SDP39530.1 Uncharacterized protein SAMN05660330_02630 [Desulforhopalus singaporensis]
MNTLEVTAGFLSTGKLFNGSFKAHLCLVCLFLLGLSSVTAYAVSSESSVMAPRASRSLLLDCQAVGSFAAAVGERGHILTSADNGKTWSQANVPTRATLTGVFFLNQNLGWAVGHDQVILRTRDGGRNWSLLYSNPQDERPLFDVFFKNAEDGVAIGAYGLYLVTSDGGDTWTEGDFMPKKYSSTVSDQETREGDDEIWDFHLFQYAPSENGHRFIAAETGNIFRSDDNTSWMAMPSPYNGSFFGVLPLEDDTLLIFGLRGHLFRSEDGGVSWRRIPVGSQATLTRGLRLKSGEIVITGLAGTLLISNDGGNSFVVRQQPDRQNILKAVQTADESLILTGAFGVKRLTLDKLGIGNGSDPHVKDN